MGETALYAPFEVALAAARLRVIPIRLNPGKFCGIGAFVKWSKGIELRRQDFTIIEGAPTGAADFMVLLEGGLTLFVEFKSPTGRQREAQAHFERACRIIGHPYVIARSVEEAVEAVRAEIRAHARGPIIPSAPPPAQPAERPYTDHTARPQPIVGHPDPRTPRRFDCGREAEEAPPRP